MVTSIAASLGIGSGIDTKALIEGLAAATKAPKEALIVKRETANAAKISALAEASNAIDSFAAALSSLISGGTLSSQPSVSDTTILSAVALAGANLDGLAAEIQVDQLAQAQSLVSADFLTAADAVGMGDLTITTATGSFTVTVDGTNNSLTGLATAINGTNSGVTATVLTESGRARLVLKSGTGEERAFTLSVPGGTVSGLERFAYDPLIAGGMTRAQEAKDAIVRVDGVQVKRSSNNINDLIAGVQIDLKRAAPGSIVSIGVTKPTAAIKQGVGDFVAAYNELHKILAEATAGPKSGAGSGGPLYGDLSMRAMQRQLAGLTSTILNTSGGPQTLAEIGVATARDGTLSVNEARLQAAIDADPVGVEALFNPRQYSSDPNITIFNKMGAVKPGTYTLTGLVPDSGAGASGMINGVAGISSGPHVIAAANSGAVGLVVEVLNPVASATVTVDAGIGGALKSIRDALRASSGPIASSQSQFETEGKSIARDRASMEKRAEVYYNQLVKSFTAMDLYLLQTKATQSYLDQQIAAWNNAD